MVQSRLPVPPALLAFAVAVVPVATASAQVASSALPAPSPAPSTGRAVRAAEGPVVDGRGDDPAWQTAPPMTGFRQFEPTEDAEPAFATEVRVLYDERNLYVLVRAFDASPDSIVALLSRRDVKTASDWLSVAIDAYHDRRTGVILSVNPAGVKLDASIYQDNTEDLSWDGVWDVATGIDSLGWTAEYRVPFSQLRFGAGDVHTFGFSVTRDIARRNERSAWPLFRRSRQAIASQLGTLEGIAGIRRASRVEMLPYVSTRNVTERREDAWGHPQELTAGLDLKYGVGQRFTLDATVNPDFGQVEADPAVLNLTAFEIRFEERRPFFQEGVGLYKCQPCQGLFYSRRIGRAPQLSIAEGDPVATTILGAAKLTGRFRSGLNVGVIEAVTQRELGAAGATVEPQTNYVIGRVAQELRQGRSSFGGMVTSTYRDLDGTTEPIFRRHALAGSVDVTHRFAGDRFELTAYGAMSHVTGSASAIARTQLSPVHLFQRPDDNLAFDPTRTSLDGGVVSAVLTKRTGALQTYTWVRRATPGMELNDAGLVSNVNDQQIRNDVTLLSLRPRWFYRKSQATFTTENHWTIAGLATGAIVSAQSTVELRNSWGVALAWRLQDYGGVACASCARGGPALRQSPKQRVHFNLTGDRRAVVVPWFQAAVERGNGGRSHGWSDSAGFELRVASRFSTSLGATIERRVDDQQWIGNFGDPTSDTTHFTFARLEQTTVGLTGRASWTATPTLSLQLYAQPFVSSGDFTHWREIAQARAASYDDRFRPYGDGESPAGFNVKQFNSNAVLRWEYRPGSTLYLVWQQGRRQDGVNPGTFEFARDYRDVFSAHPVNTFLVKVAYWLNP